MIAVLRKLKTVTRLTQRTCSRRRDGCLMKEVGRERTLTGQEELKFLMLAPQPLHDVAVCILDAGMRPEEVFRMRWENFRWEDQIMEVAYDPTRLIAGSQQRCR